jgi:LysR family nitrogen assimilation transcriptional regulator
MEANNMDLRQLRYFIAVAERGGFAAAASTLNVAQSALSRHVKELEHELGGKLPERGARGVSVTGSGKVLLARGRWLLGTIDDIKAEVRTENREPSGTVRLGVPASLAEILYAPFAKLFVNRFPKVRLEMSEGLTEGMSDRLLRGGLDVAIVTVPQPNDHLDYETLVVEQVFLIGPPRDPLLKRGRITRKEFDSLPAGIAPLSRNPFPPTVPFSLRVESSIPMKRIVASGLGYGLLPFSGIHEAGQPGHTRSGHRLEGGLQGSGLRGQDPDRSPAQGIQQADLTGHKQRRIRHITLTAARFCKKSSISFPDCRTDARVGRPDAESDEQQRRSLLNGDNGRRPAIQFAARRGRRAGDRPARDASTP